MAFTKITHAGIGSTGTVLLENLEVTGVGTFGGSVSVGGTLTYEDVTNVDSVGLITARNGVVVGSGITLSKDGDIFATGVTTTGSLVSNGAISGTTGTFSAAVSGTTGTFTGDVSIPDTIVHTGDTNTKIRFPADDTVTVETAGSEAIRITSERDLGVGMGSPWARLVVHETSTNTDLTAHNYLASQSGMSIENGSTTDGCFSAYSARVKNNAGTQQSGSLAFKSTSSGYTPEIHLTQRTGAGTQATRLRINSSGKVNIGDTQMSSNLLNVEDGTAAAIDIASHGTGGDTAYIGVKKSSGGGLTLGISNRDIIFKTGASYSSGTTFDSGTERFRITSAGQVKISGADDQDNFVVDASQTQFVIHQDSSDGEVSIRAQDGSGNNYAKFMTFGLEGGSGVIERLRINSAGDVRVGSAASTAGLRYFDVVNSSNAANTHGSLVRLITSNAANTGTTSVDIVKYKDGNFYINNNESSGSTHFYTGGATRMTINQNGIITKPYTPSFFATINGGDATTNTNNKIPWNVVKHNTGNHYDTSNYYFVAPVSGHYYFFTQLWAKNGTSNARFHFHVEDASNSYAGDNITQNGFHSNGLNLNDHTMSASVVWYLDVGDRISVRPDNTNLTYYTAGASDPHSYFCGYMIG